MLSLNLTHLIDDEKCYETVRQMRWTRGVCCPKCKSSEVNKRGKDETQPARQRYQYKTCNANFDDLTDTIFAAYHQPIRMWILCRYLMGLNLSNRQIAQELDLDKDVVQDMGSSLKRDTLIWVLPSENACKTYSVGQKLKPFQGKLSRLKLIPVACA
jgi:transposase-like protein